MFDALFDGIIAALPWKVQLGCLVFALAALGVVVLWVYYG